EIGKGATELAWALFRSEDAIARVRAITGWEQVEKLRSAARPILFVTPHLGSYDIAGRYLWSHLPILAMYRPHKIFWIDQLLREGPLECACPADRRGAARRVNAMVEKLVRACPAQYLWGYNRHKRPAGAPPPPAQGQLA